MKHTIINVITHEECTQLASHLNSSIVDFDPIQANCIVLKCINLKDVNVSSEMTTAHIIQESSTSSYIRHIADVTSLTTPTANKHSTTQPDLCRNTQHTGTSLFNTLHNGVIIFYGGGGL